MTDKQRDSIDARARELYSTDPINMDLCDAFRAGAAFGLELQAITPDHQEALDGWREANNKVIELEIKLANRGIDDRLFETSKAAMQGRLARDTSNQIGSGFFGSNSIMLAHASVDDAKALLAVLEEEEK